MPTLGDVLKKHKHSKKDKRIFGLVLQGGGMRGAYTAGTMIPLILEGFNKGTFEHVIGSSAGAINGAYFVDDHLETMVAYTDDLSNKRFVNLLRKDKKVDIDYVVDDVLKLRHPLNAHNLDHAYSKLHTVLTDAETGKKIVISDHHKFAQIYEELRATAALPVLYDKQIRVGDRYYIDGGVSDLIPIDVAIDLKCTDIVVIMTQQVQSYHFDKQHKRLVKRLLRGFAKTQSDAVRKVLPTNEKILKANLRLIKRPFRKIRIYLLEPSNEEILISLGTIDRDKVVELAFLGISDMEAFLNKEV